MVQYSVDHDNRYWISKKKKSIAQNHIRFQGYVPFFPVAVHNTMQCPLIHRLIN